MRLVLMMVLSFSFALTAMAETPQYNYGHRDAERRAWEEGVANNSRQIDRIARREYERTRRSSSGSRLNNCGKSYWTKAEALRLCPPATAMKIRQDGEVFYHCDCSN